MVQVGLGGVIAPGDELLGRTVGQQALDFEAEGIQLGLAQPLGPSQLEAWQRLERLKRQ